MSIDPLKTNLTAEEAGQLLIKQTAGKTFSDGPYEYRIAVKSTSIINGLIITVTNDPERIGPDLIKYALTRLEVIIRNYKERNQLEFYVIKIWMDVWGHRINFGDEMLINPDASNPDFTFSTKDAVDDVYKIIDFSEGRHKRQVNEKKLQRYVDHFNSSYSSLHASVKECHFSKDAISIMKVVTGVVPEVNLKCISGLVYSTTIENGDMVTNFNIEVDAVMDIATCEWDKKITNWLSSEEGTDTRANSDLRHELINALSTTCRKAIQPIKDYFLHSLVHVDNINISVKPVSNLEGYNRTLAYSLN